MKIFCPQWKAVTAQHFSGDDPMGRNTVHGLEKSYPRWERWAHGNSQIECNCATLFNQLGLAIITLTHHARPHPI